MELSFRISESREQWLATQTPLPNTVTDFWQMVLEQKAGLVVQLEISEIKVYPSDDYSTMVIGPFIINRNGSTESSSCATGDLILSKGDVMRKVTLIEARSWSAGTDSGLPTPTTLLEIYELLSSQQISEKKICVTCLDGSTRCGLFICVYNSLGKIEADQEVDVYRTAISAKMRRPQFISSLEQYMMIYETLGKYFEREANYANVEPTPRYANMTQQQPTTTNVEASYDYVN